ncbi:alpha/beta hydrolase [Candidatus Nomurabacteria bacterium]|nr:alpha/beta hydrolase [Candidatus Nomurabacteria bacterium]
MKPKAQLLIVHGGETFRNRKDYLKYLKTRKISLEKRVNWAGAYLEEKLGKNVQIIRPEMPLKHWAEYEDWKIWFERYIPFLKNGVILVGCSLGGIFLAKYLSEKRFPKKLRSVYLVCPPFDNSLPGEDLVGGFKLKSDLSLLEKQTKNLYLLFSADDPVVPVAHAEKYRAKLPGAKIIIYKSKGGHFGVPTFPEIIKMIKDNLKR